MRRIIRFLICLFGTFGAILALGQTPTSIPVQGNVGSIIGNGLPYAGVSIQLQNCPSPASIAGYSVIVQQGIQVMANGSGVVNTTVWPNDIITCNGTTGNSQYQLTYIANGAVQGTTQCYQIVSTQVIWNLNTQQPVACSQSPANPQDASYRNLNSSGYFQGANGGMAGNFIVGSLAAGAGHCVQIGTGGLLTYTSGSCGSSSSGVTQLVAGTNITLSPSGGTGVVTINATGGGSGTINFGLAGQLAYYASEGTVLSGINGLPVSMGGSGATTAAGALVSLGAMAYGGVGIPFALSSSTARQAVSGDVITLLGYTPLRPSNNLSDVSNSYQALTNLFSGAALYSTQLLGITSAGLPSPVIVGGGLTYQNSSGVGSVTSFVITSVGTYTNCPAISFTGGGGTGATGWIVCTFSGGHVVGMTPVITSSGSGYSSAPSVVFDTTYGSGGAATAILGAAGRLTTSWQSGTFYSVAGTPLPTCSSSYILQRLAVIDATVATPGSPYAGGGPFTIPVECIFNATGSSYTWIID